MINVYNLFITQIFHGKTIIPVELHQKIINHINKNYIENNKHSCMHGYQLHEDFDGKKELMVILNNYLNNFHRKKILNGWLNVLESKSYNSPHTHTGSNINSSGVFYLSPENNEIHFSKGDGVFSIKPSLFDYLIFPFDLIHYVLPDSRPEKRISFAFNLTSID